MFTAVSLALSLLATAQEKADSVKVDILLLPNVELNEVNVLGTWAQKDDPIAQINLTEKDVEALNTGHFATFYKMSQASLVSLMPVMVLDTQTCVSVVRISLASMLR